MATARHKHVFPAGTSLFVLIRNLETRGRRNEVTTSPTAGAVAVLAPRTAARSLCHLREAVCLSVPSSFFSCLSFYLTMSMSSPLTLC